jgi:protein-disulfide isomerase
MAGKSLKPFYIGLGVIAVAGAALIFYARARGASAAAPQDVPTGADTVGGSYEPHVLGSDSAPVTVDEYADFECPACAQFAVLTAPDVRSRLVATGEVRWVFHDFPLSIHKNSMPAHEAAQCAAEQGKFFEMHDQLFFNHGSWVMESNPRGEFRDFAAAIGLDMGRYDQCMSSGRYLPQLEQAREQGTAKGVSSTPTFDINGKRYTGAIPYDDFKKIVETAAAAAKGPPAW